MPLLSKGVQALYLTKLLILSVLCCRNDVFLEQPGPSPVVAPIGAQVQLNCSVVEGQHIIWYFYRHGSSVASTTDQPGVLDDLRDQGITVESFSAVMSLLTINATVINSQKEVTCVSVDESDPLSRCASQRISLGVFGPPSTPTNLTATENGVGSLRISWFSTFSIEGVTVEFTLTATNLNTSNTTIVRGIQEQLYIFTLENSLSCDVYSFQVTALNAAGSSGSSEIVTRSLPSLPDISAVEDSLEQSLVKTADGVTLNVIFQGIISCPEYPVTNVTLLLVDPEGNETRESTPDTSGEITLVIDELIENSLYSYRIEAINMIGKNVSNFHLATTTDVQGISICIVEDFTYSIQCIYITGSDARGCVYTLVSGVEGVANITGTIDRSSYEGVQIDLPNVGEFVELLAFDWERDNNVGTVSVLNQLQCLKILISGLTTIFSGTWNTDVVDTSQFPTLRNLLIMIIFIPALLFAIIFLIIFGCFVYKKKVDSRACEKSTDVLYETVNEATSTGLKTFQDAEEENDATLKTGQVIIKANPSYGIIHGSGCAVDRLYEEIRS